jgi:tetratricopeptide (TPR) repeat protein
MLVLKARLRYINSVQGKVAGLDHLIFLKEAYEKATKLEPYNANYHYELSRVLYSLGDIKLASLFRNRAIELFPSQPIFKKNLGFTEKADQKM